MTGPLDRIEVLSPAGMPDYTSHPDGELWLSTAFGRLAEKRGDDVIVCPYFVAPLLGVRKPMLFGALDALVWEAPESYPAKFRQYLKLSIRRGVAQSSAVFTLSTAAANALRTHVRFGPRPLHVVPGAVNAAFFRPPNADERSAARVACGCSDATPLLVNVAGFERRKGHAVLLEALRAVSAPMRLAFVGSGSPALRDSLRAAAAGLPVEFHEPKSHADVRQWLHAADLFVFPSAAEGFGLPPLEALACGLPVIAGDIPAAREVLGDSAFFLGPKSTAEWSAAISRWLEGDRSGPLAEGAAAVAARVAHASSFTWESAAQGLSAAIAACVR